MTGIVIAIITRTTREIIIGIIVGIIMGIIIEVILACADHPHSAALRGHPARSRGLGPHRRLRLALARGLGRRCQGGAAALR